MYFPWFPFVWALWGIVWTPCRGPINHYDRRTLGQRDEFAHNASLRGPSGDPFGWSKERSGYLLGALRALWGPVWALWGAVWTPCRGPINYYDRRPRGQRDELLPTQGQVSNKTNVSEFVWHRHPFRRICPLRASNGSSSNVETCPKSSWAFLWGLRKHCA